MNFIPAFTTPDEAMNYTVKTAVKRVMKSKSVVRISEKKQHALALQLQHKFQEIFIPLLSQILQNPEDFNNIQQQYYEEINAAANNIVGEYTDSLLAYIFQHSEKTK